MERTAPGAVHDLYRRRPGRGLHRAHVRHELAGYEIDLDLVSELGSTPGPVTTREIDLLEQAAAALLPAPSTGVNEHSRREVIVSIR